MKKAIFILFIGFSCQAQWSTDPSENNIVSWFTLNPIITTDMENGIIVVAQTHPVNPIIYAQRMSVHGERLWPGQKGVQISSNPNEQLLVNLWDPEREFVMSDRKGGCYIAFQIAKLVGQTSGLDPDDMYDYNLYLQRLDANGNRLFGDEGIELMHEEIDSVEYRQEMQHWCSDGEGGVYLLWFRYNKEDVENSGQYMCRISDLGKFIWGPTKIHPSTYNFLPYLDSNKNINLYYDPATTRFGEDKFIKIDATTGSILKETDIEIGVGEHGFSSAFMDYFSSDNFSAIFVFRDFRADTLRAQKIDENGKKLWGERPVFVATGLQYAESFDAESDKNGGAYVLYQSRDDSLHLIHIDREGKKDWKYSYPRTNWWLSRINENLSAGGDGSVFLIKEKGKYLTKLNIDGRFLWETQVTSRDTIASEFTYYGLLADEIGGCIVLWMETGNKFYGLRAQRINSDGKLGDVTSISIPGLQNAENTVSIEGLYPNPANHQITIKFTISRRDFVRLKIVNILGEEVIELHSTMLTPGQHTIVWDGLDRNRQEAPSGVYFLLCQSGVQQLTKKFILIK